MNLDFDKIWASDTSPDYPSDTQTKRGLSYLGTEPPTFDLHDAIFQRLDKKDQWLYDQVRLACERFGQNVSESVAGESRDTMANAITNALLTQRKADEGGYGIVRMADYYQTEAGSEYNLAVSPAHLAEYVDLHNTWDNTKNKPQTATRWPGWDEVTGKPSWGSAAWKDVSEFDPAGAASKIYESSVQRDYSFRAGFVGGDISSPYIEHSSNGKNTIVPLARTAWVNDKITQLDDKNNSLYVKRDGISIFGFFNGNQDEDLYVRAFDGTVIRVCRKDKFDALEGSLKSAAFKQSSDFDPAGAAGKVYDSSVQRDYSYRAGFVDGDALNPYMEHSKNGTNTIVPLARASWVSDIQNSLGSASTKPIEYFDLGGAAAAAEENAKSASCVRNASRRVGFIASDVNRPYIEHYIDGSSTIVPIATSEDVGKRESKITRGIDGRYGMIACADGYKENWGSYSIGTLTSGYKEYTVNAPSGYSVVSNVDVTVDCTGIAVANVKEVTTSGFKIGVKLIEGAGQFASIFWKIRGK